MKLTETSLRRIIRKVLLEINTPLQAQQAMTLAKGDMAGDMAQAFSDVYPEKRKGIKLKVNRRPKRKGIKLKVNRVNYKEDSLVLKLRKDLNLQDIISKSSNELARTIDPEFESKEKVLIKYDIKLIKDEKDESKTNSFVGPLIGKKSFLIRYEGDVFDIKIRYMYPEDRFDHEIDMANKFKDLGFSEMTESSSYF